jgi:23S rRNA pseudouridine1911/1915/1917 synthase
VKDLSGIGGELRPGIVHRLDKGTSGVMVVAKNDAAHQELSRQFHDREVEKEYVALVWGWCSSASASTPRSAATRHRQKMSTRATRAREAVTRVTWARTCRRLAAAGGHLHGPHAPDPRPPERHRPPHRRRRALRRRPPARAGTARAVQRLARPFLHAERLSFTHPRTGERLTFVAPLPADLEEVLRDVTPLEMRASLFGEGADDPEDDSHTR